MADDGHCDLRIDVYIERAPDYAQAILAHLREVVHAGCPDVVESMKWSHPAFEHHGLLAGMAAFKQHAVFGFWKHQLVVGESPRAAEAMGSFGCLKALSDLPARTTLLRLVKKASKLNEDGVSAPRAKRKPRAAIPLPSDFGAALTRKKKARATFDALSPSQRRDYLEWIVEAKRADTRARRIATALEWLGAGKTHSWKYERR